MSVVASQQRNFRRLLDALRPHWHRDSALPARIQSLLARQRSFGARDRRLYRELIYTTLRYLPWIEPLLDSNPPQAIKRVAWLAAATSDTTAFRAETAGDMPEAGTVAERAAHLGAEAEALLPEWLRIECPEAFQPPELEAQLARAPLWLRLQTGDVTTVADEFAKRAWRWRESPVLPSAWQVLDDADVTTTSAYGAGAIEVQDLGSQLLLEAVGVEAGSHWLDACAGTGGKTLQLARLAGPAGRIDAHDVRSDALDELERRAYRARQSAGFASIAVMRRPPSSTTFDAVLIDAPCSGSGTWRRAPHLKWTTTPEYVRDRSALQLQLLTQFAAWVRPGGLLVYATCSLARSENEAVVAAFLARHDEFTPAGFGRTFDFVPRGGGLTLLPSRHDTDGFFVAPLRRSS